MVVYKLDYNSFSQSQDINISLVPLVQAIEETEFWIAICDEYELCVIQVSDGAIASRILIYQLPDENSKDSLVFLTELDIHNQSLKYMGNGCLSPYLGDKIILCAHSYTNKTAYAYAYDLTKNEFTQIRSKGIGEGSYCWGLSRVGKEVCGIISRSGLILKFKFSAPI